MCESHAEAGIRFKCSLSVTWAKCHPLSSLAVGTSPFALSCHLRRVSDEALCLQMQQRRAYLGTSMSRLNSHSTREGQQDWVRRYLGPTHPNTLACGNGRQRSPSILVPAALVRFLDNWHYIVMKCSLGKNTDRRKAPQLTCLPRCQWTVQDIILQRARATCLYFLKFGPFWGMRGCTDRFVSMNMMTCCQRT